MSAHISTCTSFKLARVIRQATAADADTVGEILHTFNAEFGMEEPSAGDIARRFAAHPGEFVTLLAGGDPPDGVAVVTFRPTVYSEGPAALLEELYVRPHRRRQGIGRELMDAVLSLARARGAGRLELNTDEGDTAAHALYESYGMTNREPGTGERMFYYERDL
jgi:GNAT superfamily N-acetyltransferase